MLQRRLKEWSDAQGVTFFGQGKWRDRAHAPLRRGVGGSRLGHRRRRLPHVHVRRARRVRQRLRLDRHRRVPRVRRVLAGRAGNHPGRAHRQPGSFRGRQGRHPRGHRRDRRGRRDELCARVRRRRRRSALVRRASGCLEHGRRGRRGHGPLSGRRDDRRLPRRAHGPAMASRAHRSRRRARPPARSRSLLPRGARRQAAPAGERRAGLGGGGNAHRPGVHRKLRERHDDRPPADGRGAAREPRPPRLPADRRARDAAHLPGGARRGPARCLRRGRGDGVHADLRRVLRRRHGRAGRRGTGRHHDEPQLPRPHGLARSRGLPRERVGCRRGARSQASSSTRQQSSPERRDDHRGQSRGHPRRRRRHRRHVSRPVPEHRGPRADEGAPLRGLRSVAPRPARAGHDHRHGGQLRRLARRASTSFRP